MLAVMWPFGSPARFADPGGAQTRFPQTMRAYSPVSAALLGHTTRPGEAAEIRRFFFEWSNSPPNGVSMQTSEEHQNTNRFSIKNVGDD
jgi:hypothetical protein